MKYYAVWRYANYADACSIEPPEDTVYYVEVIAANKKEARKKAIAQCRAQYGSNCFEDSSPFTGMELGTMQMTLKELKELKDHLENMPLQECETPDERAARIEAMKTNEYDEEIANIAAESNADLAEYLITLADAVVYTLHYCGVGGFFPYDVAFNMREAAKRLGAKANE